MEAGVEKESGTILRMGPWMSKINADNGKLLDLWGVEKWNNMIQLIF